MKKVLLVLMPVCLSASLACTALEDMNSPKTDQPEVLTVTATIAESTTTKTILQPDKSIYWTAGDAINLFYGSSSSGQFVTNIETPAEIASFTGTLTVATGAAEIGLGSAQSFWGVYPYNAANTCDGSSVTLTVPSEQGALAGSFADKLNPSVATAPGLGLSFYNLCAPFYFSVTEEGVTSAKFTGNGNEVIAGKVRVTMDSNGKPVAEVVEGEGAKSITITAPEGGFVVGTTYVIILLPQTLESGYTLTLSKADYYAKCVVSKSASFVRSQGRSKLNADSGLTYVSSIVPLEAIDMGLSVKWANKNIGASAPENYGDYYAWGETETKENYSWSTYAFCNGSYTNLTKYCTMSQCGTVDNKTELENEDDVAHVKLGGNWRIPTASEFDELVNQDNCTWEWTTMNEVNGYKITSKKAGYTDKWIFLPANGCLDGTNYYSVGEHGNYWTSSLYLSYSINAVYQGFDSSNINSNYSTRRYRGQAVRAVSE